MKDPTDHYHFCKILLLVFVTRLASPANTLTTDRAVSLEEPWLMTF